METQTSAGITGTQVLPSLASSVLRNVFGGYQPEYTSTEEPSGDSLMERPSEIAQEVLTRLETRKERAATELGISSEEVESLPFDLSTLESEGIFMNIDCRGFGSLVRQLEWKTLGVQLPENAAVRVSPPRAGLLPDIYRNRLMRGAAQLTTLSTNSALDSLSARLSGERANTNGFPGPRLNRSRNHICRPAKLSPLRRVKFFRNTTRYSQFFRTVSISLREILPTDSRRPAMSLSIERIS